MVSLLSSFVRLLFLVSIIIEWTYSLSGYGPALALTHYPFTYFVLFMSLMLATMGSFVPPPTPKKKNLLVFHTISLYYCTIMLYVCFYDCVLVLLHSVITYKLRSRNQNFAGETRQLQKHLAWRGQWWRNSPFRQNQLLSTVVMLLPLLRSSNTDKFVLLFFVK